MKKKNTSQALNLYRGKMQLPPAAPHFVGKPLYGGSQSRIVFRLCHDQFPMNGFILRLGSACRTQDDAAPPVLSRRRLFILPPKRYAIVRIGCGF